MKKLDQIQQILTEQKPYLLDRFGVVEIGVFGSYIRNEQTRESDIDLLVELERPLRISLIGLVELQEYLSKILGIQADIAVKKNLKKTNW